MLLLFSGEMPMISLAAATTIQNSGRLRKSMVKKFDALPVY